MGKVMSIVSRKVNRFNVENRAHKVLEREKPVPAPTFESNLRDLQRTVEVDPGFLEKQNKKDSGLDDRLKQVYVTSNDSYIDYGLQRRQDESRSMPLSRSAVEDFEYGYKEPTRISRGKCTLRQAMQFITDHQMDPDQWTKEKIADEYKIKEETIEKVLLNFRSFQIYIPDPQTKENVLTQSKQKQLPGKENQT